MGGSSRLGDYLRARRALVRPEDVGIQRDATRRQVTGLRREEVARLAGISAEYYLRLEQGRDAHPSDQVVEALGRALALDDDALRYALQLARPPVHPAPTQASETLPGGWQGMIDDWSTPAMVHGRRLDVLASNRAARAMAPMFTPGVNLLRAAFFEPEVALLYANWHGMTQRLVGYLLALAGPYPDDPQLVELVADLSAHERFRALWARQDVTPEPSGVNQLRHPVAGPLEVRFERLAPAIAGGPTLVVYHAEPGTDSAAALARLVAAGEPARPVAPAA